MSSLRAIVPGAAAAGGSLPQWNRNRRNQGLARKGAIPAATQSSIAVCADGGEWAAVGDAPFTCRTMPLNGDA